MNSRLSLPPTRNAGFQPAVSPICNRLRARDHRIASRLSLDRSPTQIKFRNFLLTSSPPASPDHQTKSASPPKFTPTHPIEIKTPILTSRSYQSPRRVTQI